MRSRQPRRHHGRPRCSRPTIGLGQPGLEDLKRTFRPECENPPLVGRRQTATVPHEKRGPDGRFQPGDALRDRGLRQVDDTGRVGDTPRSTDHHKGAEMAQVQMGGISHLGTPIA